MKKSSNSPPKSCRRERWRRVLALTLVCNLLLTALGASFKVQPVQATLAMTGHAGAAYGWSFTLTTVPNFLNTPVVGQTLGTVAGTLTRPSGHSYSLSEVRAVVSTSAGTIATTNWSNVAYSGTSANLSFTGWSTTSIGSAHDGKAVQLSIEHRLYDSWSGCDCEGISGGGWGSSWNANACSGRSDCCVESTEDEPYGCTNGDSDMYSSAWTSAGPVVGGGDNTPTPMPNTATPIPNTPTQQPPNTPITFPNTPTQLPPHLLNSPTPITFPNTPTQLPPHLLNSPTPITFIPTNTPLPGHLLTPKVAHNANG